MPVPAAVLDRLASIPNLTVKRDTQLASYTRFNIGGPATVLCDAVTPEPFVQALATVVAAAQPSIVIGGGTNLIVSDAGFDGIILKYSGSDIQQEGVLLRAEAGAVLQDVVDASISAGLKGLETLTGIPGFLGGAVYGNAGAYGHSMQEILEQVHVTDGTRQWTMNNSDCQFRYRESIFKERKDWIILSAHLRLQTGDEAELVKTATGIRAVRDAKYPPDMKCAGSIFKNIFFADLPGHVQPLVPRELVREGKVPSAWFLEQTGVKGLRRGDIQVANYHANLIYNDGSGSASDLTAVIQELKHRVSERFHFELEEEVQYVGFEYAGVPL